MRPKHKQFQTHHASIFGDDSVVAAYKHRPSYPPETFALLEQLMDPNVPFVLDVGCGPGPVARAMVRHPAVTRVDAVDIAQTMIDKGRTLPEGDNPKLRWICGEVETAQWEAPYGLITAAASLHWMHWETVMARFEKALAPKGVFALVSNVAQSMPWSDQLGFINDYSTNKDFKPYSATSVVKELEERGIFHRLGTQTTAPIAFRQPLEAYIESFHARNGLSRDRLNPEDAKAFGHAMRKTVSPYTDDGHVTLHIQGQIIWGKPQAAP